jgi:hypothetical protein
MLSTGNEAVVVQWHLEKQDKTFISRLGQAICSLSLSNGYGLSSSCYFATILADNSLKVVRFDNNKTVMTQSCPSFSAPALNASSKNSLVVVDKTRI